MFDLCAARNSKEQEELRCQVLSGYAIICQEAGATLASWRDHTHCGEALTFPSSWSPTLLAIPAIQCALRSHPCPPWASPTAPPPTHPVCVLPSHPPSLPHPGRHTLHLPTPHQSILLLLASAQLCSSTPLAHLNVRQEDTHSRPTLLALASIKLCVLVADFVPPFGCQPHIPRTCRVGPSPATMLTMTFPSALACPANTVYQSCMTPCPASCANLAAPRDCEGPCVEGCASLPGYVYSGAWSLPLAHCGCTNNGVYYQVDAGRGGLMGAGELGKGGKARWPSPGLSPPLAR